MIAQARGRADTASDFSDNNTVTQSEIACGGEPIIREIRRRQGCGRANDCDRRFQLYFPTAACNAAGNPGTLPLVFTIHCLGGSLETFAFWKSYAEEYNFVWVNPEGVQHSFNAGNEACCGYALQQGIDDLGFFKEIIEQLSEEYSFISPDFVYATGWSNGGYMVSYAAALFRAVAPIAGYQIEKLNILRPTGLFLHHSQDDTYVRITGCCKNSSMPSCCCKISEFADRCVSAQEKVEQWATQFNKCPKDVQPRISFSVENQVDCYTYDGCQANTTYCFHQGTGHFGPAFLKQGLTISKEIPDFFCRDACSFRGGSWNAPARKCSCPTNFQGLYCLNQFDKVELIQDNQELSQPHGSTLVLMPAIFLIIAAGCVIYRYWSRHKRYEGFRQVSTIELGQVGKLT